MPQIRAIARAAPAGLRLVRVPGALQYGPLLYTRGAIDPLWYVATPSALIARFEVWVDGHLSLAAPGTHRTAPVRPVPPAATASRSGPCISPAGPAPSTARMVSDATAPTFTSGPDVALRTGSLDASVPSGSAGPPPT